MKILVIQQKMIGDVLTSSILFEALRAEYPGAQLHYLIHKHTVPVVENNPFIDKFILFDPEVNNKPTGLIPVLKKIKKEEYDIVIDVYAKIITAFISAFSGAEKRISYYKKYTSAAYTHTFPARTKPKTNAGLAIENRLLLLKAISPRFPKELKPKIYLSSREKESAKAFLEKSGISEEKPLFMISIMGSSVEKTYPLDYMAAILNHIVSNHPGSQLLFNYIPSQLQQANQLYEFCSKKTRENIFLRVYGKSLREFMAITSHCNAVIGNEGGAINMAKALDIPTFAIFSPWINMEAWHSYENNLNVAVHLRDYRPDLMKKKNKLKKDQGILYKYFLPDYILPKIKFFLENFKN